MATYEEDQAKLKREANGEREIKIAIPKEPEVRPEIYKDVEAMLFRGFLILSADINEVPFVFKSLNQHEFDMLRLMGGFVDGKEPSARFWTQFLTQCVFLVDGINVLTERSVATHPLTKLFEGLPLTARQRIIRYVSEVNRRASNAVTLTEAFVMEKSSRFRWAQLRGLDLTSPAVTGIEGTQSLGLNWAQLLWRALNYYEDLDYENEREWENAKFVGSCFAGKGLQKVYNQDSKRRDTEKTTKAARKDQLLRHVLLGEPLTSEASDIGGTTVKVARTVEELSRQLEADLKGEKDFHDEVVDAAEQHTRDQYQQRRQELEELVNRRNAESDGRSVSGGTDMVGLSAQEVHDRILHRKQLDAQAAASRMVYPELEDPKLANFLDRIGVAGGASSQITQTDRDPTSAVPLAPSRGAGSPFRR